MANSYADQTRMGQIHGWHLYLIEEEGEAYCKIGTALTIDYRLSGLKNGNPRPLTVVKSWHFASRDAAYSVERKALELCEDNRLAGRDWIHGSAYLIIPIIEKAILAIGV